MVPYDKAVIAETGEKGDQTIGEAFDVAGLDAGERFEVEPGDEDGAVVPHVRPTKNAHMFYVHGEGEVCRYRA